MFRIFKSAVMMHVFDADCLENILCITFIAKMQHTDPYDRVGIQINDSVYILLASHIVLRSLLVFAVFSVIAVVCTALLAVADCIFPVVADTVVVCVCIIPAVCRIPVVADTVVVRVRIIPAVCSSVECKYNGTAKQSNCENNAENGNDFFHNVVPSVFVVHK